MATEPLYRWDETQVDETTRVIASVLMRDLVNSGGLVPVKSICVEHWLPPIRGREFCAGGTEHDMGDWWEWDCDIRKVSDGE